MGRAAEGSVEAVAEGLVEPVERDTARVLRRAVLEHARTERRRRHPPVLHLGRPGEAVAELVLDVGPTDPGLRTDVVAALRVAAGARPDAVLWLTREAGAGLEELQDLEAGWLAASRAAYVEAQVPLVFVLVTRHGWWDPRSGLRRTWVRIR